MVPVSSAPSATANSQLPQAYAEGHCHCLLRVAAEKGGRMHPEPAQACCRALTGSSALFVCLRLAANDCGNASI